MQHFLKTLRGAFGGFEGQFHCSVCLPARNSGSEQRKEVLPRCSPPWPIDLGGISEVGHGVLGFSDGSCLPCLYQLCPDLQNLRTCETPWLREIEIRIDEVSLTVNYKMEFTWVIQMAPV